MSRLGTVAAYLWPATLLVLGALVMAQGWSAWPVSVLFIAMAVGPMFLLRGVVSLGISRWATASALVLLLLLGSYLLTADAGLSFSATVRDAVPRLLTAPRPYPAQGDLLVAPLLLIALTSLLVGLRAASRIRVEPVTGAAVLYLAGVLLTGGAADPWGVGAVLILAVALLGWVLLDEHTEPTRQRIAVSAPLTALGAMALAAVALVPLDDPFDPRDVVEPPLVEVVASNPLISLGAWAGNPQVELMRVRGPAVPLRLATLEEYDGRQWTSATTFAPPGTGGRPGLPSGGVTTAAGQEIQIVELGGNWLPSPGRPSQVSDPSLLVDPRTGTLLSPDPIAGLTYSVSGVYDDPDSAELEGASVPISARAEPYTRLPALPAELVEYSAAVTRDAITPYARAVAIENAIRSSNRFSTDSISGSALWRISRFLLGPQDEAGGRRGSSEQFATAYAVVARANGLPSRVVVGFRPGEEREDGSRSITAGDAFAWPEVYFEELGWVPFSPTPNDDTFRSNRPVPAEVPDAPAAASEPEVDTPVPAPEAEEPAAPSAAQPTGGGPRLAYVVGGSLLALGALLLGARAVRRRRHLRRGAVGAWSEVIDALRLSGSRPHAHQSADTIAEELDHRFGISAGSALAGAAQRDAFGPAAVASLPTPLALHLRAVRRHTRSSMPRWRRWWWHLDPRIWGP